MEGMLLRTSASRAVTKGSVAVRAAASTPPLASRSCASTNLPVSRSASRGPAYALPTWPEMDWNQELYPYTMKDATQLLTKTANSQACNHSAQQS